MAKLMVLILCWLIAFYQRWIAILLPYNRCIYHPSCSKYCVSCLKKHGLVRGGWFSIARIASCHPYNKGGADPVPD
ncbi:MAG: membrane protein insertion efficiency factor YidD [SAR324 cluster bacterium]|nr:membrane protein insertion efficiency factor YidD [SAR324 cluster bacterium]